MTHALDAPATLVDHLIRTCGGGEVLCLGESAAAVADQFRRRGVHAVGDRFGWNADASTLPTLPGDSVDLVVADGILDGLDADVRRRSIHNLLRISRGALLVRASGRPRIEWERELLTHACRKHPLHQLLIPYQGFDWEGDRTTILVERLPAELSVGLTVADLAATRDLHMDMLREAGRRADAHVARYMFAREFIRPGDRVLDAACGLGYGTAILADGTLAESVEGVDADAAAVDYATEHYGHARSRVTFTTCDVRDLESKPTGSVDAIVSFETLEHIADPEAFLKMCRRLLTPGGRLIGSVPNEWLNDEGVDPNPYHLQVFNRERLETMCRRHLLIEHTYAQTAGGGMKLRDAKRRLWRAEDGETDAEWWLLVAMADPTAAASVPFRHGLSAGPIDDRTNVLAFERDYENPWLVRAMVTIGLRTESPDLLEALAHHTLATQPTVTADSGAALCVRTYQYLSRGTDLPDALLAAIAEFCAAPSDVPHVQRWQVSLRHAEGLARLRRGERAQARTAFEACASADAVAFNPLLATKTVASSFMLGWMALQARDFDRARDWWTHGITEAERALRRPWTDLLLDRSSPVLFGLREATTVVDLASQCASGLALLPHAAERPGVVASQLFESLQERAARASQEIARLSTPSRPPAVAADVGGAPSPEAIEGTAVVEIQAAPEPPAPPPPVYPTWRLREHLAAAQLTAGDRNQLSEWDAEIEGEYTRNVFLHPPATLEVTIPFIDAGRVSARVALHPSAWGRESASGCHFTMTVDGTSKTSVFVDPHTREAHRRWIDLVLDVPTRDEGFHVLTLETRSEDAPHFGWALFRDVTFVSATAVVAGALPPPRHTDPGPAEPYAVAN